MAQQPGPRSNFDLSISEKIERLSLLSRIGKISNLTLADKDYVNNLLNSALAVIEPNGPVIIITPPPTPTWPRHSSFERNRVLAYRDDYCGEILTELKAYDSCASLSGIFGNSNVWSLSINGQCVNTPDTSFKNICAPLVELASSQKPRQNDLQIYKDDYCSEKITTIDPGVNCDALGNSLRGINVWSVKIDSQCINTPDKQFSAPLCNGFQEAVYATYENDGSRRRGDAVELFSDDYCADKITSIVRGTSCDSLNKLFDGKNVWSVRFRGNCVNISDTNFIGACRGFTN